MSVAQRNKRTCEQGISVKEHLAVDGGGGVLKLFSVFQKPKEDQVSTYM